MEEESNYIKTFQEEFEPDSHSFVNEYFQLFKSNFENNKLPKEIRFLDDHAYRISAPTTNKTYLTAFFSKPGEQSYIGKFSLADDGADIKKEYKILKHLQKKKVCPEVLYYGELDDELGVNFLFTTVEGVDNNLNGTNPQFWWDKNKEVLIDKLLCIHKYRNELSISSHDNILISEFFENILFEEENLFEYIFQSDSDQSLFDFISKCKEISLKICSKLDAKDLVLCHNNLCKSSVLFEPNSEEKFKFINFHKAIIAPPAIDLLSIYHRLSLEEDDVFRSFDLTNFRELKSLYESQSGKEIDFSQDIRFLNTIQRMLLLVYENNFPPVTLFQSNPLLKFRTRTAELKHLKERFLSIINHKDFSYSDDFFEYDNMNKMPFKELLLYG